jgi:hypothetical protein
MEKTKLSSAIISNEPIVFISYSAKDSALASAMYIHLRSGGVNARKAPEDIRPGENWAASITLMIEQCSHFVLLWTSNSIGSKQVSKELTLAMDCGSVIIPFRSEDRSPEGAWRYHLANVQWLEAHAMSESEAFNLLSQQISPKSEPRQNSIDITSDTKKELAQVPSRPLAKTQDKNVPSSSDGVRRKKIIAGMLALFFGTFGVHKFFLGQWRAGCVYLGLWIILAFSAAMISPVENHQSTIFDVVFLNLFVVLILLPISEAFAYLSRSDKEFYRLNISRKRAWF